MCVCSGGCEVLERVYNWDCVSSNLIKSLAIMVNNTSCDWIKLELTQSQPYTRSRTSQPPLHYNISHVMAESRNSYELDVFPIFDNFLSPTDDFLSLSCFFLSLTTSYQHGGFFHILHLRSIMCVLESAWGQRVHFVPKGSHPCSCIL